MTKAIHQVAPLARIVRARYETAVGSLLLAYDALGVPVTAEMTAHLEESMPCKEFFDTAG